MSKDKKLSMKPQTEQQWKVLLERYYAGYTTSAEERWLKERVFCVSDSAMMAKVDRAVLSYGAIACLLARKQRVSYVRNTLLRVAAVVLLFVVPALIYYQSYNKPSAIAYVNGKVVDDREQVEELMMCSLQIALNQYETPEERVSNLLEDINY